MKIADYLRLQLQQPLRASIRQLAAEHVLQSKRFYRSAEQFIAAATPKASTQAQLDALVAFFDTRTARDAA